MSKASCYFWHTILLMMSSAGFVLGYGICKSPSKWLFVVLGTLALGALNGFALSVAGIRIYKIGVKS